MVKPSTSTARVAGRSEDAADEKTRSHAAKGELEHVAPSDDGKRHDERVPGDRAGAARVWKGCSRASYYVGGGVPSAAYAERDGSMAFKSFDVLQSCL